MDYNHLTKDELIQKVYELELLNQELLKENMQSKEDELDIRASHKKLLMQSTTDELTGLKNRRSLMQYMEMAITSTSAKPLSMVMFDIDDFAKVNDSRGHNVGDQVLIEVGQVMVDLVRKSDMVSRYGGEEFVIVYSNTALEDAIIISERIRKGIEKHCFDKDLHITISGGVYQFQGETLQEFINKADKNLYKAKNQGKNQII